MKAICTLSCLESATVLGARVLVLGARVLVLGACAVALGGCSGAASLGEVFSDAPASQRYASSLEDAGLHETALGREWITASERALRQAPGVEAPYLEAGYLSPAEPGALGYRLHLRRGHRLAVEVEVASAEPGRVFVDLFRVVPGADSLALPEHVASSAEDSTRLDVEVRHDGEYVLRLQPELLRGGRYQVTISRSPTLAFPVEGAENRDIGSGWGDPREGGSRNHQGVDIFAPRGTPALAAEDGRIRRAGTNRLGGNTIWLSGGGDRSFYYAHLDRQAVRSGDAVRAGDTIGWVGNTGNAASTPPHLHFGVRLRGGEGWVDAYPYIARTETEPAVLGVDTARLGGWIRSRGELNLRRGPGLDTEIVRVLPRHTVARALAGTTDWFRVELPDRNVGFVAASLTEDLDAPVTRLRAAASRPVRDAPTALAAALDSVDADADVPVLGRFGEWALVRAADGDGWVYDGETLEGR